MADPIVIDGSQGEGGGQILRTALALSLVTRRPFRIENVRARRSKPGLLNQHLTAVNAAASISGATVSGNALRSLALSFAPGPVEPGSYRFSIGTAGSCTLVLQTVLPALLTAGGRSDLVLEGGTHNPLAPPFDFLAKTFLPILGRMGGRVTARLERPGFYPGGGGTIVASVEPAPALTPIEILERGAIRRRRARATVANLPRHIAERELAALAEMLGWSRPELEVEELRQAHGPGNVLTCEIESEALTEVFAGFGERGVRAEEVARRTAEEVTAYLEADVPVGPHLADQLLIPLALAGGGAFRTLPPTMHTMTNAEIVRRFLDVEIDIRNAGGGRWEIAVARR